jgi:hypothetical protein
MSRPPESAPTWVNSSPSPLRSLSNPVGCRYSDGAHELGVRIDLGLRPWRLRCTHRGGATVLHDLPT